MGDLWGDKTDPHGMPLGDQIGNICSSLFDWMREPETWIEVAMTLAALVFTLWITLAFIHACEAIAKK